MTENQEGKLTALFDNPITGKPERVEIVDADREYWNAMVETQGGITLCVHIDNLRGFETFYDNGRSDYHGEAKRDTDQVGRVVDGVVIWNK